MEDLYEQNSSPVGEALGIVAPHKWKIAGLFIVVMGITAVATALSDRAYRSESKLFVRVGRTSATLDPSVTTGQQFVAVADPREAEINAVAEMIKSRATLDEVCQQIGINRIRGKDDKPKSALSPSKLLAPLDDYNLNPFQVHSEQDDALKSMAKKLKVGTARNSNVISVSYQAKSPELAQEVLKSIIDLVRERHAKINQTRGSQQFFEEECLKARVKLAEAEQRRAELKTSTGLADLVTQREKTLSRIRYLEDEIGDTSAKLAAAETETIIRSEMLKTLPASVVTEETTGEVNSVRDNMREELFRLETREKELTSKFSDDSIYVKQVRDQLAKARAVVDTERQSNKVTKGVYRPNEQMTISLNDAKAQRDSLQSKLKELREQAVEAQGRLKLINEKEHEFQALDREIQLADNEYREFHKGYQQTLIDEGLQEQKITNINELQAPSLMQTPVSPAPLLNIGMGLGIWMLASVGLIATAKRGRGPAGSPPVRSTPSPEPEPEEPEMEGDEDQEEESHGPLNEGHLAEEDVIATGRSRSMPR